MTISLLKSGRIGRTIALVAGVAVASAAIAQTVPDSAVPDTGLNIPSNLQLFGKRDPNVRKPTAIVNDAVLTGTDVDQRLALVLAANNANITDAERQALRQRVLGILIDETLQIQEAKAHDVTVTTQEIDQSFNRVAKNFQKSVPEMRAYLRQVGSSDRSLRRQIEAELAWNRYLRRRVEPFVNIGDEEVSAIIKRLEESKGTVEYHVKEIYLAASPEREQQIYAETKELIEEIQQGKRSFEQVAQARSDASTRAVGGDLAWIRAEQLPESLAQAATSMQVSQIAGPIASPGGFSILYLVDKRQVLTADPRDAVLSLRQVSMPFPKGISQTDASARVAEFAKSLETIHGCGDVTKAAAAMGAEVVDNDAVRVRDLPPQLQEMMTQLKVGEATPPFGSPTDGVRSLVLCGRDAPQTGQAPGMEQVRRQMEEQAVNLRAEHKLRDLRRDAVIEYR